MDILIAILVFGVLIVVHELGHFTAAKLFGVYVEKFSVGFGKRLIGKKIGETEYCISLLPLGGYVKMYGENSNDEEDADPAKAGRSFSEKKAWQRAIILFAGPFANVILAFIIFSFLFMSGFPDYSAVVGEVKAESAGEKAGLVLGDKIVKAGNKDIVTWSDFVSAVSASPGKPLNIVLSDGRTLSLTPDTVYNEGGKPKGSAGVSLYIPAKIGAVFLNTPADKSGIQKNDEITAINGNPIRFWKDITDIIHSAGENALVLEIKRKGEIISLSVTPEVKTSYNEKGEAVKRSYVGIGAPEGDVLIKSGFFGAINKGFVTSYNFTGEVIGGILKLISREVSADSLGGPIMIVQMTADSAKSGFTDLAVFLAVISLNLAVFNLLPIPVLDGGHLFIIAIETVIRRRLSENLVGKFQLAGFALLMCLMVFAFYNDISRIFTK